MSFTSSVQVHVKAPSSNLHMARVGGSTMITKQNKTTTWKK